MDFYYHNQIYKIDLFSMISFINYLFYEKQSFMLLERLSIHHHSLSQHEDQQLHRAY